ncbi:hypothetical protein IQ268_12515 [Oculatella sp. LEGE 06141]|uniref:hypothetical protein n=1 Tax=Oculatella sp. LEGE 06141 TaxID=1828648 RepID=UPI001881683E|nr:hypothetical protein [Oculatella sp. LEGE 06141]MBE9179386.1 hypothetical protein [Oculatella sp. LEGE 06141]
MTEALAHEWDWWFEPWKGLIICGSCEGFMHFHSPCLICGQDYRNTPNQKITIDGQVVEVAASFRGAIGYSDYTLLRLMYQEWQRPLAMEDCFPGMPIEKRPSLRLMIVILFWTLFESLMDRFFEAATYHLPKPISEDILNRYSSIGSRFDRLYKILFSTTMASDLRQLGYGDLMTHLTEIQKKRNAFIHGEPEAINDDLVRVTLERLPEVQRAWIGLYNLRCTRPTVKG